MVLLLNPLYNEFHF